MAIGLLSALACQVASAREKLRKRQCKIREAIEGYVLALQEDGLPIPPERFDAVLLSL